MAQNLKLIRLTGEFTRPSNTTAYSANKVVSDGTLLTLSATNPDGTQAAKTLVAGGSYQIKSVEIVKSSSGTTNASYDVWIYSSGITAFADRANFTPTYENKSIRIGKTAVTMGTGDTNSTSAEGVNTDVNHVFVATGPNLYAVPVVTAAYTPTSAEKFYVKIVVIRIDD